MAERLLHRHSGQFRLLPPPERTARCGENELFNLRIPGCAVRRKAPAALKGLKNCGMLAVHRQKSHTMFPHKRHNQVSRCNQGLLIGECDILSGTNCFHHRPDADHADDCRDDHLNTGQQRAFNQTVHAGNHLYRQISYAHCKICRRLFVVNTDELRHKLPRLFLQKPDIPFGGKRQNPRILIFLHYFKRLSSD